MPGPQPAFPNDNRPTAAGEQVMTPQPRDGAAETRRGFYFTTGGELPTELADHPFVSAQAAGHLGDTRSPDRCAYAKSRDDASTFCWRTRDEHPPVCCPEFARTGSAHTEICPAFQANDPARYATGGHIPARAEGVPIRAGDQPIRPQLMPRQPIHPLPQVWSSAVPPGGYVCAVTDPTRPEGICGMPVESEPCTEHDTPEAVTGFDPSQLPDPDGTKWVLSEVLEERARQESLFPDQHLPDGTSGHAEARRTRDLYRRITDRKAAAGRHTWWDVLREEFYEAGAETTPDALYTELIQTAAVAVRWAEDIRRRQALPNGVTLDATMAAREQDRQVPQ